MEKYQLEYVMNTSPKLIFPRIGTPSGLAEWFADDVKLDGKIFKFYWDGNVQEAELIHKKTNESARFRWLDEDEDTYFEFSIVRHELTRDIALIVTDFADEDEKDDAAGLWNKQISQLKRALGI